MSYAKQHLNRLHQFRYSFLEGFWVPNETHNGMKKQLSIGSHSKLGKERFCETLQ